MGEIVSRFLRPAIASGAILALAAAGWYVWRARRDETGVRLAAADVRYAGSDACAACHRAEADAWRASQHAGAMAAASPQTVLGRFDTARSPRADATFIKMDGRFVVRTAGPDGRPSDFAVEFTFGLSPLQQYLIRLPGGRLQAFSIAWDSRRVAQGGQRWFDLYPREVLKPGDPLHWTGLQQNWNFMCGDCHSTGVIKGYDAGSREFHTTWTEISVGCEACHGPGSRHVETARAGASRESSGDLTVALTERRDARWTIDATGLPVRSRARTTDREIEVCARCHSRRSQLTDAWRPGDAFENGFRPALIEPALFHLDGQQRDEVYTYTSFLQSRMYARGVTCADCHDPHSGKPRLTGNALCTQCHQATRYDASSHHLHRPATEAAACAACHMPVSIYMQVDGRHDHSLRIPRPDETVRFGVPNACTASCHATKPADWAAREIARRRTDKAPQSHQRFTAAFAAADRGEPGAAAALRAVAGDEHQPAVVRASALVRLTTADAGTIGVVARALVDPGAMVRRAALEALSHATPDDRVRLASALLADPIRTVRIQAAFCLADLADRQLAGKSRTDFDRAFDDLVAEARFNADRPEAQTSLGTAWLSRQTFEPAIAAFREAIRLDRTFSPAYVNLADALRARGDEPGAETALRDGLASVPGDAALHHALGLALVRQRRLDAALGDLSEAVRRDPSAARFSYTYGVALHDTGKPAEAVRVLRAALDKHPADRDVLLALASFTHEAGRTAEARSYVRRLLAIDPNDAEVRELAEKVK